MEASSQTAVRCQTKPQGYLQKPDLLTGAIMANSIVQALHFKHHAKAMEGLVLYAGESHSL